MVHEVIYRGHGNTSPGGGRLVTVETPDGKLIGQLLHVVRHSPTGMTWGYSGSGPADLARSLLVAALGDDAKCPECAGTSRVAAYPDGDAEGPVPYDPEVHGHPGEETYEFVVSRCYCRDGIRGDLPYQDFKQEFVAAWGERGWTITRSEILAWYDRQRASRDR
jgi:hypothetical protein